MESHSHIHAALDRAAACVKSGDESTFKTQISLARRVLDDFILEIEQHRHIVVEGGGSERDETTSGHDDSERRRKLVTSYRERIKRLQLDWVRSKEGTHAEQRSRLFDGSEPGGNVAGREREAIVRKANDVTSGLRRIRSTMVTLNARSGEVAAVLDEDSGTISKTDGELTSMQGGLTRAGGLLSRFQLSEWMDTIILSGGFLVFLSVILYIVTKRLGIFFT